MADILLVEPDYKSTYPPIGLMKISYFHKHMCHDYVRFAKGKLPEALSAMRWDRVYVTTLFTFEWKKTKEALEYGLRVVKDNGKVYTGGILATLMPDLIKKNFPDVINNPGLLNHEGTLGLPHDECIDTLPLDYSMLEDVKDVCRYQAHDAYFTYTTRGCGMNCTFCAVKTLEPEYKPYVSITEDIHRIEKEFGPKKDLLLMDNNVLRSPRFEEIVEEIKSLGFAKGATFTNPKTGKTVMRYVDFNQGLDAFLLTPRKAKLLGELAIKPARIAFDHIEDKEAYIRAITLCAENGIDHMSNYLLYNGVDFSGKGHNYHADTPEDLYERMKITMELSEKLTKKCGRKISIFSFPMRYIPLNDLKRGFIGTNWNAKYLRAFQSMLIPTQGKGVSGRSFFEADFGKDVHEFMETLAMPENLILKRGFFVERKNESDEQRSKRYIEWSDNQSLIKKWIELYRKVDQEKFLTYISDNHFEESRINLIEDGDMKKLYLMYFTEAGQIRTLAIAEGGSGYSLVRFVKDEIPVMYDRIIDYASSKNISKKQFYNIVKVFGKSSVRDIIEKKDLFETDTKSICRLGKAANELGIGFDFELFRFLPIYDEMNLFSDLEKNRIKKMSIDLDEKGLRCILLDKLEELEKVLKGTNIDMPGQKQLFREIEISIKEAYRQLTLSDFQ